MKRIEAIIRPTKIGKVCTALEELGGHRPMISQIEDHGGQEGIRYLSRGKTYRADLMIKSKLEVIVKDTEAGMIVKAIRDAAFTGDIGDGAIFVHSMDNSVVIETGRSGDAAA